MAGRVPRGAGIGRAVVAVCRHLVRDGIRFVDLVTDNSIMGGENVTAKSECGFLLTFIRNQDRRLKVGHTPHMRSIRPLVLRGNVGDSSPYSDWRNFTCHSRIMSFAMRS